MNYPELRALPAFCYKNPIDFRTKFPACNDPKSQEENFQRGLKQGNESFRVYVTAGGVWGADGFPFDFGEDCFGDDLVSAKGEGIGYHAGAADFWRGVLASETEVGVFRDGRYWILKNAKDEKRINFLKANPVQCESIDIHDWENPE